VSLATETRKVELRLLGLSVVLPTDNGALDVIRSIVRDIAMRFPVDSQLDWLFHDVQIRAIMKVAVDAVKLGADPDPHNIAQAIIAYGLSDAFKSLDSDVIAKRIETLVQEGRGDQVPTPALARFVSGSLTKLSQQRRLESAGHMVLDEVEHGEGDASRRYRQATQIWESAAPPVANLASRTGTEMAAIHGYEMALRAAGTEKGLPRMELPGVFGLGRARTLSGGQRSVVPLHLSPGLATLVTAKSGFGKTMMANEIAFTNAVRGLREGYPYIQVLFLHDEDIPPLVMDRYAARVTGFPVGELEEGYHQEEVAAAFTDCADWLDQIHFVHCPGARIPDLIDSVRDHAARLDQGQQLLVIMDYISGQKLNLIDMPGDNDAYKLNAAFNEFKKAAEALTRQEGEGSMYRGEVHVVMLSQLNDQDTPYGNRGAAFFGQLWINLVRREVEMDELNMTDLINKAYERVYGLPPERQEEHIITRGNMAPIAMLKVVKQNMGPTPASWVLLDPRRFLFLGPHPDAKTLWYESCCAYRRIDKD